MTWPGTTDYSEADQDPQLCAARHAPAAGGQPPAPRPAGAVDRDVLVALYNATGGPSWENDENWLSDLPLVRWYGVTADRAGRVTGLWLSDNQLSGEIPPELGKLANLEWLDLHDKPVARADTAGTRQSLQPGEAVAPR